LLGPSWLRTVRLIRPLVLGRTAECGAGGQPKAIVARGFATRAAVWRRRDDRSIVAARPSSETDGAAMFPVPAQRVRPRSSGITPRRAPLAASNDLPGLPT
jgi:hypothetical protein